MLEYINIPSTVDIIKNDDDLNSFYGCDKLKAITVHTDNKSYSSIDGVLFNKEQTILMAYPSSKSDQSYSIPEGVTQVYGHAFNNSYIKNLSICQSVEKIEGSSTYRFEKSSIMECENLQNIIVESSNEKFSSEYGVLYNKEKSTIASGL